MQFNRTLAGFLKTSPFIAIVCALNINVANAHDHEVLSYNDVFELEYAASPQVSPNGETVIYERRGFDIMTDSRKSNLWQIDLNSGASSPLLSGKANYSKPTYSPDGKRLAYVSSVDGKNQLYVRYLATGNTVRVTNLQSSPNNISWSPDGKSIAFSMFKKAQSSALFKEMPAKPEGAKWAGTATYIDATTYRADGAGFLPSGYQHLYIVPSEGGTPRQITTGNFHHNSQIVWTKDGKQLLITADLVSDWEYRPYENDIYQVNVASGEITNLTNRQGPDFSQTLSPNGKKIAFLRTDDRKLASQNPQVYLMNLDGSSAKSLTPNLDRPLDNLQWAPNGKGLYFSYDDFGKKKVGYISTSGKFKTLEAELGGASLGRPYTSGEFAVTPNNGIIYSLANSQRPADLAYMDRRGKIKQLTTLNEDLMAHKNLANVESITVKSSVDGRDIQAWYVLPSKPLNEDDKTYPLILEIHGGPHATYGPHFSMEVQLMAAKGYAVVWANPRGSTSYGEEFANLIHHNYPSQDYNDLIDVVDAMTEKPMIDKDQLYITGGSGGGTLTAWSIGKTNRFKAAVVAKPVINWLSFTLTADGYTYYADYWVPGKPWEQVEHLWKHSPLSLVGNVETPTMLLTGEVDYRTPMSETEQYYQALKLRKIDTSMVRIKKASHGIAAKPSNLIQKVGNIIAWFEKYRK